MALQEKYKPLIDLASQNDITDLQVREQNGVLYIDGTAPNADVKNRMWDTYGQIDPDFRGGDLVMNIKTGIGANITKVKVTTQSSNLNIRKGPGTDQPIVGKAAHNEVIDLISRANDQWWLVRTDDGEEGYAYAQYLTPVEG